MKTILLLTLSNVFMTFAIYYLWAALCLVGAAYFMFRQPLSGGA